MIYKAYSIGCDCDGCYSCEDLYVDTMKEAKTEARKAGWIELKNHDWVCTFCNEKRHNKEENI